MNDLKKQLIHIGNRILSASRNELYLSMRFLDLAFSGLQYDMNLSTLYTGTDGEKILYNPRYLMKLYQSDRVLVNRLYLHMLLHCIFRHMLLRQGREEGYWNLACDIAVESMIDGMQYSSIRLTVSDRRQEMYTALQKNLKVLTAEGIYRKLILMNLSDFEFRALAKEFWVDDHSFWQEDEKKEEQGNSGESDSSQENKEENPKDGEDSSPDAPPQKNHDEDGKERQRQERQQKLQEKWESISQKMKTNMETFSKEAGQEAGNMLSVMEIENREKFSYRRFLEKFVTNKEEIQVDEDSWDTVFYTYGLQLYGNMPLIEALEHKEVKKVEELVIAIDTSESCSTGIIKDFLSLTYGILKDRESFFKKFNIHIIQSDADIQADYKITTEEELSDYMQHFEIKGQGGTDFRPVFSYVEELLEKKEFKDLKGLLYFTDGYGTFPKKRPSYDTVFLFLQDQYYDVNVPPWAMKLIISPEDIQNEALQSIVWRRENNEY